MSRHHCAMRAQVLVTAPSFIEKARTAAEEVKTKGISLDQAEGRPIASLQESDGDVPRLKAIRVKIW